MATAGDYRLNIAALLSGGVLPLGTYLQSAETGQENILTAGVHVDASAVGPIQIRLGTDPGTVEGSAINEKREPAMNATVVLVPEPALRRQRHLYKVVTTDLLGRFTIENVPPGNYKLFGWDHVTDGAWQNEAFLSAVEARGRAITVTAKSITSLEGLVIPR
jgi:hypothetical protein